MENKKEMFKKGIRNSIIFIIFVLGTFYFVFKDDNIIDILGIISTLDVKYIVIAFLFMLCFFASEGINIGRVLRLFNIHIKFKDCFKYGLVGFFFSSVTPSSSGGDPMQLYYMKKDGLSISHSTLALLTEFSSFQFITIIISIIGFFMNFDFIQSKIGNIKYLLIIGIFINTCILVIVLLAMFSKKVINKIVNFICKVLEFLNYKKVEEFRSKCLEHIKEYKLGANLLKSNKKVCFKILLTTTIQILLYHSIPFLVYKSFGLDSANIITFISLQSVLYISVSSLPFPGAVGVSEGGFLLLYKLLFPEKLLSSAMLVSRGVSFYFAVLISGILISIFSLTKRKDTN